MSSRSSHALRLPASVACCLLADGRGARRRAAGQRERRLHDAEAEVELGAVPDRPLRRGVGRRAQLGHVHRLRQQRPDPAVDAGLPVPRPGDRARRHRRPARRQHQRHRRLPAALPAPRPQGRVDAHGQAPDLPDVVGQPRRHLLRADPPARSVGARRRDRQPDRHAPRRRPPAADAGVQHVSSLDGPPSESDTATVDPDRGRAIAADRRARRAHRHDAAHDPLLGGARAARHRERPGGGQAPLLHPGRRASASRRSSGCATCSGSRSSSSPRCWRRSRRALTCAASSPRPNRRPSGAGSSSSCSGTSAGSWTSCGTAAESSRSSPPSSRRSSASCACG